MLPAVFKEFYPQTRTDTGSAPVGVDESYRVIISEDPIGFEGGINFFAYVHDNPVNKKDPKGLAVFPPDYPKFPPTGGWPPSDPGTKKCMVCKWADLPKSLVDQDCIKCRVSKWKDFDACAKCVGNILDSLSCHIESPDSCGNCP